MYCCQPRSSSRNSQNGTVEPNRIWLFGLAPSSQVGSVHARKSLGTFHGTSDQRETSACVQADPSSKDPSHRRVSQSSVKDERPSLDRPFDPKVVSVAEFSNCVQISQQRTSRLVHIPVIRGLTSQASSMHDKIMWLVRWTRHVVKHCAPPIACCTLRTAIRRIKQASPHARKLPHQMKELPSPGGMYSARQKPTMHRWRSGPHAIFCFSPTQCIRAVSMMHAYMIPHWQKHDPRLKKFQKNHPATCFFLHINVGIPVWHVVEYVYMQASERVRRRQYANFLAEQEQQNRIVENLKNMLEDYEVCVGVNGYARGCCHVCVDVCMFICIHVCACVCLAEPEQQRRTFETMKNMLEDYEVCFYTHLYLCVHVCM